MGKEFLSVRGTSFIDDNRATPLRGFCFGNWLNLEHFMIGLPGTHSHIYETIESVYGKEKASMFWESYQENYITEKDFQFLRSLNINVIRIPFNYRMFESDLHPGVYDHKGFYQIDRILALCEKYEIFAILDFHSAPGGQNPDWHSDNAIGECLFWEYPQFQDRVINLWAFIADHYKSSPYIAGYDLLNEPAGYTSNGARVNLFMIRCAQAIRKVDSKHILFIEGDMYGHEFSSFEHIEDPNIAYSIHHYPFFSFNDLKNEPDLQTKLENSLRSDPMITENFNRLKRPVWCGETGVPLNRGETDSYIRINNETLSTFDKMGISWTLWTYKDARGMGSVVPKYDSPWMNFSRNACDTWNFWDEFLGMEQHMESVEKLYDTKLNPGLRRKIMFRTLADRQMTYVERFKKKLAEYDFSTLLSLTESFHFDNCEIIDGITDHIKQLTSTIIKSA